MKRGYAGWQGFAVYQLVLKPAGKQYFERVSGEALDSPNPFTAPLIVVPLAPIRPRVIEVTGITHDSDAKIVEYKWQWDPSTEPNEVNETIFEGPGILTDQATFKLYDDGWRIARWGKPPENPFK